MMSVFSGLQYMWQKWNLKMDVFSVLHLIRSYRVIDHVIQHVKQFTSY